MKTIIFIIFVAILAHAVGTNVRWGSPCSESYDQCKLGIPGSCKKCSHVCIHDVGEFDQEAFNEMATFCSWPLSNKAAAQECRTALQGCLKRDSCAACTKCTQKCKAAGIFDLFPVPEPYKLFAYGCAKMKKYYCTKQIA